MVEKTKLAHRHGMNVFRARILDSNFRLSMLLALTVTSVRRMPHLIFRGLVFGLRKVAKCVIRQVLSMFSMQVEIVVVVLLISRTISSCWCMFVMNSILSIVVLTITVDLRLGRSSSRVYIRLVVFSILSIVCVLGGLLSLWVFR